jgi:hypothetical protein
MTTNIQDRFIDLSVQYACEYADRSMARILDALPEGADRAAAELRIRHLYITNGSQLKNCYAQVFDDHLQLQFAKKPNNRQPLLICFSGPFGAGKTTLQSILDSGNNLPENLKNLEAIKLYRDAKPFKFEFSWAWNATGLYNPANHQGDFPYARAAGAGSKDAAMELAIEQGLDLIYASSLTPHTSDGVQTLQNELDRLQSYKNRGYKLFILGCAATKETCLARIAQRDRRPTDAEVVKSVEGFWQHYDMFAAIADSSVLLDTGFKENNYRVLSDDTNPFPKGSIQSRWAADCL